MPLVVLHMQYARRRLECDAAEVGTRAILLLHAKETVEAVVEYLRLGAGFEDKVEVEQPPDLALGLRSPSTTSSSAEYPFSLDGCLVLCPYE